MMSTTKKESDPHAAVSEAPTSGIGKTYMSNRSHGKAIFKSSRMDAKMQNLVAMRDNVFKSHT